MNPNHAHKPAAVFVAFYRGRANKRVSFARLGDWITRRVTRGEYSHCEIAVARDDGQYQCYSASFRDGGVRGKVMVLPGEKWDLIPVAVNVQTVMHFYDRHAGKPYDWRGVLGFVFYNRASRRRWFCSEFCSACLGFAEPWRISPSLLYALLNSRAEGGLNRRRLRPDKILKQD